MKQIQFKAKSLKGDTVIGAYFDLIKDDGSYHHFIIPQGTSIPKDKKIGDIQVEVNPETIGQSTGILDKNGRTIFEGDRVRTKYGRLCKVIWLSTPCHQGFDLVPLECKNLAPDSFDLYESNNLEVVDDQNV